MVDPRGQEGLGELLGFLAPGLVHGLGNVLFAVQGHGQLIGVSGRDLVRERNAILEAAGRGSRLIQVLRTVLGETDEQPQQAGVLLQGLAELLRVALRDRALTLAVRHTSRETPRCIDGPSFSRAVITAVRAFDRELPAGFLGEVYLDLFQQTDTCLVMHVGVCEHPDFLPFPFDVAPLAVRLQQDLAHSGVRVRPQTQDRLLVLEFPLADTPALTEAEANLQGPFTES